MEALGDLHGGSVPKLGCLFNPRVPAQRAPTPRPQRRWVTVARALARLAAPSPARAAAAAAAAPRDLCCRAGGY